MMSRVRYNFEHGRTAPTRPMVEKVFSGGGVSRRDKTVRPLDDREGGPILPSGYGEE